MENEQILKTKIVIGISIILVLGLLYIVYKIITTSRSIRSRLSASQKSIEVKTLEIVHKSCGQKIYYSEQDIRYGDLELISSSESIQRAYIDCPHCKEQLTFSFND